MLCTNAGAFDAAAQHPNAPMLKPARQHADGASKDENFRCASSTNVMTRRAMAGHTTRAGHCGATTK